MGFSGASYHPYNKWSYVLFLRPEFSAVLQQPPWKEFLGNCVVQLMEEILHHLVFSPGVATSEVFRALGTTVDGRNPTPPGTYKNGK